MRIYKNLLLVLLLALLTGCDQMLFSTLEAYAKVTNSLKNPSPGRSSAMSVSASSDGRYVISAHRGKRLYLWDVEQRRKTQIANNVNIYSAYFIPGTNAFMWQNQDREVILQTVDGQELRRFTLGHDVYGHVMNLERDVYVSVDADYAVRTLIQSEETLLKAPGGSFMGYSKVLNLSLSADARLLVTAGSGGPYHGTRDLIEEQKQVGYRRLVGVNLWSLERLEPIAKLPGNSAKTHASISPDGQWVISGDENGKGRFWNTRQPEKALRTARYHRGVYLEESDKYDQSGLISAPAFEKLSSRILAALFIHESYHYLQVTHSSGDQYSYAALFEAGNPWPIKYFDLGTDPWPSTREYSRNLTIATAPEAGILVTGQDSRGGINVYQFDAEALTLERIWVGR